MVNGFETLNDGVANRFGVDARNRAQIGDRRALLNEVVRIADAFDWTSNARIIERFQYRTAKTPAAHVVFHCNDQLS